MLSTVKSLKTFFPLSGRADKLLSTPKKIAFVHQPKLRNDKSGCKTRLTP